MSYQTLLYSVEDAIATITLNRPEALNTIVPPMPDEIEAAVNAAVRDERIKVIILRGAGRSPLVPDDALEGRVIRAVDEIQVRRIHRAQQHAHAHLAGPGLGNRHVVDANSVAVLRERAEASGFHGDPLANVASPTRSAPIRATGVRR